MSKQIVQIPSEYYPCIPRESIVKRSSYQLPIKELSGFGGGIAVAAAEIASVAMQSASTEGLYRCVFPKGVSGSLAMAKDGSGFLGTILNNGIAGQARWIPVEANATMLPIDPITIAIAVAMMSINVKLDAIHETQREILNFLHEDKEAELEGAVNTLANILDHYRFNSDNSEWTQSQLVIAMQMKALAEHNIIFYRKQISDNTSKQKLVELVKQIDKRKNKLNKLFQYYQLGVYLFSYASFLEILLSGNFDRSFLNHVVTQINNYSIDYKKDYSDCYNNLHELLMRAVDAKALNKLGQANRKVGDAIAKIPLIRKGPVDELLQFAGDKMMKHTSDKKFDVLDDFRNNRDAGIQFFTDNIKAINTVSNKPLEMYFDSETVYLVDAV